MSTGEPSSSRRTAAPRKLLFVLVALLTLGRALAYDGVTFGVQVAPPSAGAVPVTANVVVPLLSVADGLGDPVLLALRGDVSYAVGAGVGPSAGVAVVLSEDASRGAPVQPFVGFGAAAGNGGDGLVPAVYGVFGWRVPVSAVLAVRLEGMVNVTVRSVALQAGLDLSPWAAR